MQIEKMKKWYPSPCLIDLLRSKRLDLVICHALEAALALSHFNFCFEVGIDHQLLAMRSHAVVLPRIKSYLPLLRYHSTSAKDPIICINDATFFRKHPLSTAWDDTQFNGPIFPNLTFELPSSSQTKQHWAVIGSSSAGKTTFLEILRGQHLCFPPTARSYPFLSSPEIEQKDHRLRIPSRAIQYVGFSGKYSGGLRAGSIAGAYLSARYESRREATDFTVLDYLKGNVELNPSREGAGASNEHDGLQKIIHDLNLQELLDIPVGNLSNGQTRRAKIAKALLDRPEVLLLDEPFSQSYDMSVLL